MNQSQTNLFSILIIIVGIVGGYLYYTQFTTDTIIVEDQVMGRDDLDQFENMNIDFKVLDLEVFQTLREIGESPVDPGEAGKRDLFAPLP